MPNHIHSKATMVGNGTCGHNAVRAEASIPTTEAMQGVEVAWAALGSPEGEARVTMVGKVLQTFLSQGSWPEFLEAKNFLWGEQTADGVM